MSRNRKTEQRKAGHYVGKRNSGKRETMSGNGKLTSGKQETMSGNGKTKSPRPQDPVLDRKERKEVSEKEKENF